MDRSSPPNGALRRREKDHEGTTTLDHRAPRYRGSEPSHRSAGAALLIYGGFGVTRHTPRHQGRAALLRTSVTPLASRSSDRHPSDGQRWRSRRLPPRIGGRTVPCVENAWRPPQRSELACRWSRPRTPSTRRRALLSDNPQPEPPDSIVMGSGRRALWPTLGPRRGGGPAWLNQVRGAQGIDQRYDAGLRNLKISPSVVSGPPIRAARRDTTRRRR